MREKRSTPATRLPSPDIEMLFALARVELRDADVQRATAAISGGVNWTNLLALSAAHGTLPLLHKHISEAQCIADAAPPDVVTVSRAESERNAVRALHLVRALITLLRLFDANGIPAVSLKGPMLAQQLYGSVSLRRTGDLDIWVAESDLPRAAALLTARGYEAQHWNDAASKAFHRRATHHVHFRGPAASHWLELHYGLHPPVGPRRYGADMTAHRLEQIDFMGTPALVLAPDDLLVFLCMHAGRHAWSRLEWACGVAELLRSGRVTDWDRVVSLSRALDGEGQVLAGLRLVHDLLDAPVPRELLRDQTAADVVAARLTNDPGRAVTSGEYLQFLMRTAPNARLRLAHAWSACVAPKMVDYEAMPLPRAFWPLYYIAKPAQLVAERMIRPMLRRERQARGMPLSVGRRHPARTSAPPPPPPP